MAARCVLIAFSFVASIAMAGPAFAQPAGPDAGSKSSTATKSARRTRALDAELMETIERVAVTVQLRNGRPATADMVVTHFRPAGPGPFPAIVVNHGRSSTKRQDPPRLRLLPMVRFWVRRGFAVVVPTRIGYGELGQALDPEAMGTCPAADYRFAVEAMATQIVAATRFAGRLGHVDRSRVLALGVSYGGFGVIGAAARRSPGFVAAINFVGGMGGNGAKRPGDPCRGDRIEQIARQLGATARVPTLWLYSENDVLWGPAWPKRWHRAFTAAGGRASFKLLPAVGEDGHRLASRGRRLWRPEVDNFIAGLGFKPPKADSDLPASGFARLDEVDRVPHISEDARKRGYAKFLEADVPRAFALAPSGAWSWRSGPTAASSAVSNCQMRARTSCRLYAVDDRVVWTQSRAK